MNRTIYQNIAKLIATFFYVGNIRIAPGTFGSIPAFPLCYMILYFVQNNKVLFIDSTMQPVEQLFVSFFIVSLACTIFIFFIGIVATSVYIDGNENQDPKEVVIDEVVGQMMVITLISVSIFFVNSSNLPNHFSGVYLNSFFLIILPFLLFRFFDAVKPWPVSWFDRNVKGAFGVMFDDVVAAIFASASHFVIVFLLIDYYS